MGILEVKGKIELSQFWPSGESDGDTINVKIEEVNAFSFQEQEGGPRQITYVFDNAKVSGSEGKKDAIRRSRQGDKHLTIRLQGIDAAELHYQPSSIPKKIDATDEQRKKFHELNKKYRQYFGETGAVQVHDKLSEFVGGSSNGSGVIACIVRTRVDYPNDVFDTYGRFIGDIIAKDATGNDVDINIWLVKEGWAFPTFYASMTIDEIETLIAAAEDAHTKKAGVWQYYSDEIGTFDFQLIFRGKSAEINPEGDKGDVILPKLFRRLTTYSVYKKVGIAKGAFQSFLQEGRDGCFLTKEFLEQGPTASSVFFLSEFVERTKFKVKPGDLVFIEKPSRLIGEDGHLINSW